MLPHYNVSTITAVGSVSTTVALAEFFANVPLHPHEGLVYAELGERSRGTPSASSVISKARKAARRGTDEPQKRRHFDNQVTVLLRRDGAAMSMKVFSNGRIHLTGVKAIERGFDAVLHLADVLRSMDPATVGDAASLRAADYRVCLINCDVDIGFEIVRERLFQRLRASYGIVVRYEPCTYPGVTIRYMWNDDHESRESDGVCGCTTACKCMKVNIAIFQSGKVLLTGAHSMEQIDGALDFVSRLAEKHRAEICKPPLPPMSAPRPKKPLRAE